MSFLQKQTHDDLSELPLLEYCQLGCLVSKSRVQNDKKCHEKVAANAYNFLKYSFQNSILLWFLNAKLNFELFLKIEPKVCLFVFKLNSSFCILNR